MSATASSVFSMLPNDNILPDRASVAKACKNPYCKNQILYQHPIKGSKYNYKIICCEDKLPKKEKNVFFYWDTHQSQLKERLKIIKNRDDLFLNNISDNIIDTEQAHKQTSKLRIPYIFNIQTSSYAHLKADHHLIINQKGQASHPEISIVIPSFGHQKELTKVIKSLYQQTVPYELIIVGLRKEEKNIKETLKAYNKGPLKFITLYFDRELGDYSYAAGHMRNIGASYACSPRLLFMDSDIIIPHQGLKTLRDALEFNDVIMPKRKHQRTSLLHFLHKKTEREKDQHWKKFYASHLGWAELNSPWQYVSTYTLGVNRSLFFKLGGFNPSFNSYGFEDVEFGYRAFKHTASFQLIDLFVNHIFHHEKRSEYNNNEEKRQRMLARSARIFFKIHRTHEILKQLKHYLSEENV